ncbi:MAG: helix-turn-helix domain-containing protein [Anaerolineales bacterium]|nr:helix-turn-helix domain-containing protein [Anaerolineales bacterium]
MSKPNDANWLTLKKAADILGVHPATLRRWADNGEIPVLLTPGGHRRFDENDIERFAAERRQLRSLAPATQVWVEKAMQRTRADIAAKEERPWLVTMDEARRDHHRILGRQLMGLTLQYISDPETNGTLLKQAEEIGAQYGRLARQTNLPLTEALQATLLFRDMLVDTAFQLPNSVNIKPEANLRLMRRINELLNVVHLAIAQAYEGQP